MRTNTLFTLLLSAFVMTGCVDSDYDLSNASAGDIAIGDENMELEIPIVTFTLTTYDIDGTTAPTDGGTAMIGSTRSDETVTGDETMSLNDMLTLINAFLPSGGSIDIQTLVYDESTTLEQESLNSNNAYSSTEYDSYLEELICGLLDELYTSSQKRLDLAEQLLDYYADGSMSDVISTFDIDDELFNNEDTAGIADGIYDAIEDAQDNQATYDAMEEGTEKNNYDEITIDDIVASVQSYFQTEGIIDALKEYANISESTTVKDTISVPSEVSDMLGDATITPSVSVESDLPFEIEISSLSISSGAGGDTVDFMSGDSQDLSTILDILSSGTMSIDYNATLNSYSTSSTTGDETLKIKVSLKVKGAIKL